MMSRIEQTGSSIRSRSVWIRGLFIAVCIPLFGFLTIGTLPVLAKETLSVQQSRRSSPYVGSAMAVLATLEQAKVLPPEGTKEADRIIQSVIQLQSAFLNTADLSLQEFLQRAIQRRHEVGTTALLEQFRSTGWTSEILEALAEAERQSSREDLRMLTYGLRPFNLSLDDFTHVMELVRNGRIALASQGESFAETYAFHRRTMPGHRIEKQ